MQAPFGAHRLRYKFNRPAEAHNDRNTQIQPISEYLVLLWYGLLFLRVLDPFRTENRDEKWGEKSGL